MRYGPARGAAQVGRFGAVELQDIERHRGEDRVDFRRGRIDEQAHLGHERRQRVGDLARTSDLDEARRAAPEIEPDGVGAGVARREAVGDARDAADLDARALHHGAPVITSRVVGGKPKRAS